MTFGERLKAVMGGSLGLLFSNIVVALRIAWPWVLLAFFVSLFSPAEPVRLESSALSNRQVLLSVLGAVAMGVIYIIAFCSVAVAWHRHGLLGEMPKSFPVRFARRELRFLGKSILVGLVMLLIMVPVVAVVVLLAALSRNGDWFSLLLFGLVGLVGYFAVVTLAMRYSLVLPATAVDRDFGVADAFRHGEGFGLVMAITNVVIALLVMVLSLLLQFGLAALAALYLTVAPAALAPTVGAFVTVVAVFFSTVTSFFTMFSGLAVVTTGYRVAGESRGYDIYGNRIEKL